MGFGSNNAPRPTQHVVLLHVALRPFWELDGEQSPSMEKNLRPKFCDPLGAQEDSRYMLVRAVEREESHTAPAPIKEAHLRSFGLMLNEGGRFNLFVDNRLAILWQ